MRLQMSLGGSPRSSGDGRREEIWRRKESWQERYWCRETQSTLCSLSLVSAVRQWLVDRLTVRCFVSASPVVIAAAACSVWVCVRQICSRNQLTDKSTYNQTGRGRTLYARTPRVRTGEWQQYCMPRWLGPATYHGNGQVLTSHLRYDHRVIPSKV